MANRDTSLDYVTGKVQKSNDKGIVLDGRDDWLNISKYAEPAPLIPAKGTAVKVGLDKSGYIRTIERASAQPETVDDLPFEESAPAKPAAPAAGYTTSGDRDDRVTRLACLNTATNILTTHGAVDLQEVLDYAGCLYKWAITGMTAVPRDYRRVQQPVAPDGFARFKQELVEDPLPETGPPPPAHELSAQEFYEEAKQLGYQSAAAICAGLGLSEQAQAASSLGLKGETVAIRDWNKAGHSWNDALAILRRAKAEEEPFS